MNSSWLLIKSLRRPLLIGGAVCFVLMFAFVWFEDPKEADKALGLAALSLTAATICACLAGFHTALFRLPVPVTQRQLAWLPTVCFAFFCMASFVGVTLGIIVLSLPPSLFTALIDLFPLVLLSFAFMDRLMRYMGAAGVSLIFLSQFMIIGYLPDEMEYLVVFYQYAWPICIGIGALFIFEAPAHVASIDHPMQMDQGLTKYYMRMPGSPVRSPRIKTLADVIMGMLILILAIFFISFLDIVFDWNRMGLVVRIYTVGIGAGIVFYLWLAWCNVQANGFGAVKSLMFYLMKCTLVLIPVTWALGAKRGLNVSCENCRRRKFVWALQCPRCGHENQGDLVYYWPKLPWKRDKVEIAQGQAQRAMSGSGRMSYRFIWPFYMMFIGVVTSNGSFRNDSFTIIYSGQGQGATLAEIREYLLTIDDARDWLNEDGGAPLLVPDQFRIEVKELGAIVVEVHCYWLRWEDADEVGERIRQLIREEFPGTSLRLTNEAHRSDYGGRVPRLYVNNFLDGGIHWEEQS